jgi:hypothetical protein
MDENDIKIRYKKESKRRLNKIVSIYSIFNVLFLIPITFPSTWQTRGYEDVTFWLLAFAFYISTFLPFIHAIRFTISLIGNIRLIRENKEKNNGFILLNIIMAIALIMNIILVIGSIVSLITSLLF